ncbi:hypothetical protein [Bacillus sp. EB600]|uniref:hypothetical protein n=1 Tax=Bacillus sp. EB600 TaxID=2806345 RepID=UPI00210CC83D|nr:hypothetical protein [Bacillus sp. EB600]MCQ6281237.1 hypothetical protein [Bacillus sp. EB600]
MHKSVSCISDFFQFNIALPLAIYNGAYSSEIFRGAIQSIEQMEVVRSLGMINNRSRREQSST